MRSPKTLIAALAAGVFVLAAATADAAGPLVEIVALDHWPVQNALEPLRALLARYDGKVRVVELDAESDDGKRRLKSVGLEGHIPVVVLIDGEHSFRRADGKTVQFVNFPAAASSPMGLGGRWSTADVEAALQARLR